MLVEFPAYKPINPSFSHRDPNSSTRFFMTAKENEIPLFPNRVADSDDDNLYGKTVSNEDEAYTLYNNYALRLGFSVRRSRYRYSSKTGKISQREFLCSKEGITDDDNPLEVKKVNRLETRTGCKAFIRFSIENGVWKVIDFQPTHNHDLASPSERHLLKSGRKISKEKAGVIDTMKDAGLSTKDVYAYISTEHGGDENVGFLQKDCSNHVHRQKMVKVEAGDAQSLMNYLKKKKAEDPMFFYAVQVDQKNRLTNFFWRDGRSKIDYDSFGDVMIFDTTFRTNKYNLICAPFVGVNHHWNNVMFGCAFLLDETAASFKWLFQSFLEAMGNREPATIFTDQDAAMAKAIREVFKTTKHRLCLWHISKNAPSHLGHLSGDKEFQALWNKCCTGCETEMEFQETWDKMNEIYDLSGHSWLNGMYQIRSKWSTVFGHDFFSAGIKSSQRSESTNNVLNSISGKTTYLTEFTIQFDKLVTGMRSRELQEDFRCKQGTPKPLVRCGILEHAAIVYTRTMYMVFQKEFISSLATIWREVNTNESVSTYEVQEEGHSRVRTVRFHEEKNEVLCSCKKFEAKGILCCHALRILSVKNITKLPNDYILQRWTKEAKKGMMGYEKGYASRKTNEEAKIVWRNSMMRIASNLIYKSQHTESIRKTFQESLLSLEMKLEQELENIDLDGHIGKEATETDINVEPILNPPCAKSKGLNYTREKGHFEKRKAKSTKVSSRKKSQSNSMHEQMTLERNPQYPTLQQYVRNAQYPALPSLAPQFSGVGHFATSNPLGMAIPDTSFMNVLPNIVPMVHLNQGSLPQVYSDIPIWQLREDNTTSKSVN